MDPALSWKDHIKRAAERGIAAFQSMSRLCASTWGPSVRRSKLIYSAVVRPIMTYGAQIWAVQTDGSMIPSSRIKQLGTVQNKCLRKIMGAYKRTSTAALEKESETPPINLYIENLAV